ncbi:hypothetical protein TNIN_205921 [Trichonephila inaurata madagascariensis]|uniref:Uncharacterized protein n=1 Tax=Trichonephila inaurata madagascariensis TaxID=2747483 RepID=A0A8X7BMX4_9ARAC|nr:hypothetical protein TNIN_205921 [Trichonephila inaurata madagascariensis]
MICNNLIAEERCNFSTNIELGRDETTQVVVALSQLVSSSLRLEKPVTPDEKTNPKRQPQDKEIGDLELRIPLLQVDDCRSGECFLSLEFDNC